MSVPRLIGRRTFLAELGHGAIAVALVSIAGCSPSALASPSGRASAAASPGGGGSPTPGTTDPPATAPGATDGSPPGSPRSGGVSWERVNLGFVSAYILVRGAEAAIVDTGVAGSGDAIGTALTGVGLDWPNVGHVIVTHHHGDHAGSMRTVMDRAAEATAYAGAEDVDNLPFEGEVTVVGDGETVFDLRIVTTPGHTAGSICVLDPIAGVLVAGDALRTAGGRAAMPSSDFSEDMDAARQSVIKLGALTFETLLVGHGDPVTSGASAMVAELGASG